MSGAPPTSGVPTAISYVLAPAVLRRNLLIAVVVGCLLTLANQFDVLWSGPFTARLGWKIFFNFVIPFLVSSTSAALNRKPATQ